MTITMLSRLSRGRHHAQRIQRSFSSSSSSSSSSIVKDIPLCFLDLRGSGLSVLERLLLEECLLQTDTERSWMIAGYHDPFRHRYLPQHNTHNMSAAIVMGIGGKVPELLHAENVRRDQVLTLKRFSGGGTVVMDHDAIWTTLIGRPHHFNHVVPAFPRPLMEFTAQHIFAPLFERLTEQQQEQAKQQQSNQEQQGRKTLIMDTENCDGMEHSGRVAHIPLDDVSLTTKQTDHSNITFALRENDYVMGPRKMGGNAQSITKAGWLHHTSFLWDYQDDNLMDYLRLPNKRPAYRNDRPHDDFLCKLRSVYPSLTKKDFCVQLRDVCRDGFDVQEEMTFSQVMEIVREHTGGAGLQGWWETKSRTRIVEDV
jgi:lipoate-protein ligase A